MREHERKDYRCVCNRKLFRAWLPAGAFIETRCPKCGKLYRVKVPSTNCKEKLDKITEIE